MSPKSLRYFWPISVAIILPVFVLVIRTLKSVEAERMVRHQALAERAFTHMDDELQSFLETEERRPIDHYFTEYAPFESARMEQSPLARDEDYPDFVVGYVHRDPGGIFHTPLVPNQTGLQKRIPEAVRVQMRLETLRHLLQRNFVSGSESQEAEEPIPRTSLKPPHLKTLSKRDLLPGTTGALGNLFVSEASPECPPWLDAFRALNRPGRHKKRSSEQPESQTWMWVQNKPREVQVEPMQAKLLSTGMGADFIYLFRNVWLSREEHQQGIILHKGQMLEHLRHLLSAGPLGKYAELSLEPDLPFKTSVTKLNKHADFVFRHRFQDPFDDLIVRMELSEIPGVADRRWVYVLSAFILLAGTLGVYFLYSMSRSSLEFAERRNAFVASISHELKTPLTVIRMYAEMLQGNMIEPESKRTRYYEYLMMESERLTRLVSNVLELSRLERGYKKRTLTKEPIHNVIKESIRTLSPHAERLGFQIQFSPCGESDVYVLADRDALLQVLLNVIENAIKYSEQAKIKIIDVHVKSDSEYVEIEVKDHGVGVPPSELDRIFESFYRVEKTASTSGTGMGLALVKSLVHEMHGKVKAENAADGGLIIRIRLNRAFNKN